LKQALVLFAHGSRDPDWARPFEKISAELARKCPGIEIRLAYLEAMRPTLDEALASLVARKATRISVVPVFLGQGGHLKNDLPKLVADVREAYRGVEIAREPSLGEQPAVIEAIAEAIARAARASP
jgi:sirohydrochlorin cobaltochelatase